MADDRFDPEPAAEADGPLTSLEDAAWSERWLAENHDWVKAKVQEALDDPRPSLSLEEVDAHMGEVLAKIEAKQAR